VTASGSTVQLQADGQPPLMVGENQDVHLTADLIQPPPWKRRLWRARECAD
jgi:hypothetical protein